MKEYSTQTLDPYSETSAKPDTQSNMQKSHKKKIARQPIKISYILDLHLSLRFVCNKCQAIDSPCRTESCFQEKVPNGNAHLCIVPQRIKFIVIQPHAMTMKTCDSLS